MDSSPYRSRDHFRPAKDACILCREGYILPCPVRSSTGFCARRTKRPLLPKQDHRGNVIMQHTGRDRQSRVWRASAIILLAIFSSLPLLPFTSLQVPNETSLPACCRTHGKHHCSIGRMSLAEVSDSSHSHRLAQVTGRCPYTPASPAAVHGHSFQLALASLLFAEILSHPSQRPQIEARGRISFDRSQQKRGPPTTPLLA